MGSGSGSGSRGSCGRPPVVPTTALVHPVASTSAWMLATQSRSAAPPSTSASTTLRSRHASSSPACSWASHAQMRPRASRLKTVARVNPLPQSTMRAVVGCMRWRRSNSESSGRKSLLRRSVVVRRWLSSLKALFWRRCLLASSLWHLTCCELELWCGVSARHAFCSKVQATSTDLLFSVRVHTAVAHPPNIRNQRLGRGRCLLARRVDGAQLECASAARGLGAARVSLSYRSR